ncbi:MAG: hypothetical protein KC416_10990, partial [Myxococcales bacterium]|nr:hypothetical protein [Myxococcales bacterium]
MPHRHPKPFLALALSSLAFLGCSLSLNFDRDKIGRTDGGSGDASTDAAPKDATVPEDGSQDGGDGLCEGVTCGQLDDECNVGTCDPATGFCVTAPRPSGTECDDRLYCTVNDECDGSGTCGGTARDCDDGLACTTDSCDDVGDSCLNAIAATSCVINNTCRAEADKNPSNDCQLCSPNASQTAWTNATSGTSCDDGQYCTVNDQCDGSGTCDGSARDCSDSISCTVDSCDEATDACKNNTTATSCNINNTCFADGVRNPENDCQICDASASTSTWTTLAPTTSCDDGLFCTVGETCSAGGICTGGAARNCADALSCTADACNDTTDMCTHSLMANQCLITGVCYANTATNPLNDCLACDSGTPNAWSPKGNGVACDDGLYCTTADQCNGSGTCGGSPRTCGDGLSCTTDSCDEQGDKCDNVLQANNCLIMGTCRAENFTNPANSCQECRTAASTTAWSNKAMGTGCNDGLYCTVGDTCSSMGACSGTARNCADAFTCTTDACNDDTDMCTNTISAGNCLISGICYGSGTPNPANPCQECDNSNSQTTWSNSMAAKPCSTGDMCLMNESCNGSGTCTGGVAVVCVDGEACTTDSCDPSTGCKYTAVMDGDNCPGGTCVG